MMAINFNKLSDQASWINVFNKKEYTFINPVISSNRPSSWVEYPHFFKYYSLHIELNQDIIKTDRVVDDLVAFASRLGGFAIVFYRLFAIIVSMFSNIRVDAIIVNRLFYLSQKLIDEELKGN